MAEQTEPVTRRVVLKIIKLGKDTRQVIHGYGSNDGQAAASCRASAIIVLRSRAAANSKQA